MKKNARKYFVIMVGVFVFISSAKAQPSNYIFGINNPSSGVFHFSKINLGSGNITNLYQLPITGFGSETSCVDVINNIYYLSSGGNMMAFDAVTGGLISTTNMFLGAGATLMPMQFNHCDQNIYGILNTGTGASPSFVKYNPVLGQLTYISQLAIDPSYSSSYRAAIDNINQLFIFERYIQPQQGIATVDISSGQLLNYVPKVTLPNETFGHIALKCANAQIFGTSANTSLLVKYLSTIDWQTGIVSHVSQSSWNVGIWKPNSGGDCIDQSTGNYYYSADPPSIVGVNTILGNLVYNQSLIPVIGFYEIQHFTFCACPPLSQNENEDLNNQVFLFPNVFSDKAFLKISENLLNKKPVLKIYDFNGRKMYCDFINNAISELNSKSFSKGIYFAVVSIGQNILFKEKFVCH